MELRAAPFLIAETDITAVVDAFYAKVRRDPMLGPIFAAQIADEAWPAHLGIIRDFWSSVMLKAGRYRRNPFAAHLGIAGLRPEHFERWLALFRETCEEKLQPEAAEALHDKAVAIADSLKAGLFFRPGAAAADRR